MNISYYDELASNVGEYQSQKYRQRVEDEREKEDEEKETRDNIISGVAPMSEEMIRHGGMGLISKGFEKVGLKNSAKIVKFLGSNPKDWAKQLYQKGKAKLQDEGEDLLKRGQEGLRNRVRNGGANPSDGGDESVDSMRSRLTNSFQDKAGTSNPIEGDVDDNAFRLQNFQPRANVASENPSVSTRTTPAVSENQGSVELTENERSSLPDFDQLNIRTENPLRVDIPETADANPFSQPRTIRQGFGSGTPQGQSDIQQANQQASQTQAGQDAMNSKSDAANSAANQSQTDNPDGGENEKPSLADEAPKTNAVEDGFEDGMETLAETGAGEDNPIGLLVEAGLGIGALFASLFGTKQHHNNPVAPPKIINPSVGFGLRPSQ